MNSITDLALSYFEWWQVFFVAVVFSVIMAALAAAAVNQVIKPKVIKIK